MFNISTFKSSGLVYGGSRPSLFSVTLSVPQGIGIDNASVGKFRFTCQAASLPPSKLESIDVPYFGRKIKVKGNRTFGDWEVTVQNDEDFSVRSLFELWSNAMNRMVANVTDPAVDAEGYKVDLTVEQYAQDGELLRSYSIVGAFPTDIGEMELDWNSTNAIQTFKVTFAYDYWLPLQESSSKQAGGINSYGDTASSDGPLGPN